MPKLDVDERRIEEASESSSPTPQRRVPFPPRHAIRMALARLATVDNDGVGAKTGGSWWRILRPPHTAGLAGSQHIAAHKKEALRSLGGTLGPRAGLPWAIFVRVLRPPSTPRRGRVVDVPNVNDRIEACIPLVGAARLQCWAAVDQYLMEKVVPWV